MLAAVLLAVVLADSAPETPTPVSPADTLAAPPSGQPPGSKEPPTPPHTGLRALAFGLAEDVKHLPSLPNLYIAAGGGGLALAVHPLDDDVNQRLRGHLSTATPVFAPGK